MEVASEALFAVATVVGIGGAVLLTLTSYRDIGIWVSVVSAHLVVFAAACAIQDRAWKSDPQIPAPKPISFEATTPTLQPQIGEYIAGIKWKTVYKDVRVIIVNDTDVDFRGLDLVLCPDHPIAYAAQTTGVQNVDVEIDLPTSPWGKMTPVASTRGVRVRCPELRQHSCIEIVMAAVSAYNSSEQSDLSLVSAAIDDRDFSMLVTDESGAKVLYARMDRTHDKFSRPDVKRIIVNGSYRVGGQHVPVSQTFETTKEPSDAVRSMLAIQQQDADAREIALRKDGPDFQPGGPPVLTLSKPIKVDFRIKNVGPERAKVIRAGIRFFLERAGGGSAMGADELNPEFKDTPVVDQDVVVMHDGTYDVPLTDTPQGDVIADRYTTSVIKIRVIYRDPSEREFELKYRYSKSNETHGVLGPPALKFRLDRSEIRRINK